MLLIERRSYSREQLVLQASGAPTDLRVSCGAVSSRGRRRLTRCQGAKILRVSSPYIVSCSPGLVEPAELIPVEVALVLTVVVSVNGA